MKKWNILQRKEIFRRKIFSIDELACKHPEKDICYDFTVMNTPDWINVVARTREGYFIMVRQHRLGTDRYTIETPAGLIEPGEDPARAAERELLEETGYKSDKLHHLCTMDVNPAIMNTRLHLFAAEQCVSTGRQDLDETEDIDVLLYSPEEIVTMIGDGSINHSVVISALSIYVINAGKYEI